jgi:hypothetical protein
VVPLRCRMYARDLRSRSLWGGTESEDGQDTIQDLGCVLVLMSVDEPVNPTVLDSSWTLGVDPVFCSCYLMFNLWALRYACDLVLWNVIIASSALSRLPGWTYSVLRTVFPGSTRGQAKKEYQEWGARRCNTTAARVGGWDDRGSGQRKEATPSTK